MRNMNVQKIVKSVIRPLKEFNSAALLTAMIISALSAVGYKYANIYTMKDSHSPYTSLRRHGLSYGP